MQWLLFTYRAPLAAFGGPDWGRRRPSLQRPGRSAILGLVATCLGVDRQDRAGQAALSASVGVAVRSDAVVSSVWDYQTTQVPIGESARGGPTRAIELAAGALVATPTTREYIADGLYVIALWLRPSATLTLDSIAKALASPASIPFAGRMACPFSEPPAPVIVEADTLVAALAQRPSTAARINMMPVKRQEVAADADCVLGVDHFLVELWRDEPVGFRELDTRTVYITALEGTP